jgi:hypothetical protein
MCGECGCIHRPGENTLCPGWRPGPYDGPRPGEPAPSAEAETPTEQWAVECCHIIGDGAHYVEPRVLQRLVRTQLMMQGLAIVPATAAQPPSAEERKVLEALRSKQPKCQVKGRCRICASIARRAAKKGKTDG